MGQQIYHKSVRGLVKEMVEDMGLKEGDVFTRKQVYEWFRQRYPKIKTNTISAHLIMMSTNARTRVYYKAKPIEDDLFFQVDATHFHLYDPYNDPAPIYEKEPKGGAEMPHDQLSGKLATDIQHLVGNYVAQLEKSRLEQERRISELEQENEELRSELNQEKKLSDEIEDEVLRIRLMLLGSPPLDVLVREAGVLFEERIRRVGKVDSSLYGVDLVDAVFNPKTGSLIFSDNPGEQEGVRLLFRGVIQFIRNPAMHKLIDYSESTAWISIKMIDALLQLLSEFQPRRRGEVGVAEIRQMLRRAPIHKGQRQLYIMLYAAGDRGMKNVDLAEELNFTRLQFSGLMGALGRRINNTTGMENKGGISLIFDIRTTNDGNILYVMRPILRKALEEERLV